MNIQAQPLGKDEFAVDSLRRIVIGNLIKIVLLERKMALEMRGKELQGLLSSKKDNIILLEALLSPNAGAMAGKFALQIKKLEVQDADTDNIQILKTAFSPREGLALLAHLNRVNARLYKSIINFSNKCNKALKVGKDPLYTKRGKYQKLDSSVKVNLKV